MAEDYRLKMAVRDAIATGLRVRKGLELNELTILERSNNLALALCEQFDIRPRIDEPTEPVDFNDPRIT